MTSHMMRIEKRREEIISANDETTTWQFDSRAGATWHCIVGRNFGSFVTHGMISKTPVNIADAMKITQFLHTSDGEGQKRNTLYTSTLVIAQSSSLKRNRG